jgi:uncharacterized protein (DUF58 family)
MSTPSPAHLLPPATLASLANLELVARVAVEGFLIGLHRSPRFGFSQEFKEYRAYVEGDDPRFVDWNVYARTDRAYIRRYEGETNTRLMILLDASSSMGFGTQGITKLQYGKFLAAALGYLAMRQHDPAGLIVFDEKVRQYRPPTSRAGGLSGLIHAIDAVQAGGGTNLLDSFRQFREHLTRRGLVVVISDLYCDPAALTRAVQPLAYHGHDIVIFQLFDPQEKEPQRLMNTPQGKGRESLLVEDVESLATVQVSAEYLREHYDTRLQAHLAALRSAAVSLGAHHTWLTTDEPLDRALRQYLKFREGRT